jgi:hypothetical protein
LAITNSGEYPQLTLRKAMLHLSLKLVARQPNRYFNNAHKGTVRPGIILQVVDILGLTVSRVSCSAFSMHQTHAPPPLILDVDAALPYAVLRKKRRPTHDTVKVGLTEKYLLSRFD